jgi:hypothetical protein
MNRTWQALYRICCDRRVLSSGGFRCLIGLIRSGSLSFDLWFLWFRGSATWVQGTPGLISVACKPERYNFGPIPYAVRYLHFPVLCIWGPAAGVLFVSGHGLSPVLCFFHTRSVFHYPDVCTCTFPGWMEPCERMVECFLPKE